MASLINSISGVLFEEFIRPWMPRRSNELACCRIMKVIVYLSYALFTFIGNIILCHWPYLVFLQFFQLLCVIVGIYSALIVWFSKDLDRLQHVASGVTGVTAGTLLGLFTLGIVFSRANCSVSIKIRLFIKGV